MLDDLQDLSDSSDFLDELVEEDVNTPPKRSKSGGSRRSRSSSSGQFLGMTAFQRFIISGMIFMMALVGGYVLMVLMGKMGLPF